jgi:hypothetical protein
MLIKYEESSKQEDDGEDTDLHVYGEEIGLPWGFTKFVIK